MRLYTEFRLCEERLRLLGREPDFIVLTEAAQEMPRLEKARMALVIMAAVLAPVILGATPIAIAAVVGAALMVLTRCLTITEAYRAIEWRAVFLIAGMFLIILVRKNKNDKVSKCLIDLNWMTGNIICTHEKKGPGNTRSGS